MSCVPGLTNRLRRDDADGLAELDETAAREIAPVALRADTASRLAREHRADLDTLDAGLLDVVGDVFRNLLTGRDDRFAGEAVFDFLEADAADDAVAEGLDDFPGFNDGADENPADSAAIMLGDDHVLGNVDEPAREVARVRRLESGIGQPLARAVGRDEVLQHGEPFTEVARDGRLDDLAGGLGHEAAHAGELPDLLLGATGAGIPPSCKRGLNSLASRSCRSIASNISCATRSVTFDQIAMTLL